MKLGKLKAKRSMKSLALGNYLNASAVAFPPVKAWERPIKYQMLANDKIGDCTIAAAAHMEMNWQAVANAGTPLVITDEQVIADYSAVTGYDPSNGSNDNGAVELDVLAYWQTTGIAGRKIAGKATLDYHNIDQIKAATYIFGGVYLGFSVPAFIMEDTGNHTWNAQQRDTQIVGGHAIPIFGYGRAGCTCVSWGDLYHMSWDFWLEYVDEAYAVVSTDWLKATGLSPTGLDLTGLMADLTAV
jgi:hypothetical protein